MRIVLVVGAMAALAGCTPDPCSSTGMAEIMAQNFVKRELREPDSAQFPQTRAVRDSTDDCVYSVTGRFSARNGFGGMTSGVFAVEMHKVRGENLWRAENLFIQ